MNKYESVIIINPNVEDEGIKGLITKFSDLINKDGTFIDSLEFLDKIDEKIIDDSKNILKRSIN